MKLHGWVMLAGTLAAGVASGQGKDPDRIRGVVTSADAGALVVQTPDGKTIRIGVPGEIPVFSLTRGSYADIDFGTYVGSVSEKLGDHIYSPIVRDSLSWLHRAHELRIIDESLRGIAVGHTRWDLTPTSVMTHGWVDDREERVISIKFGPTDEEETDVEIPRDVPVMKMSVASRSEVTVGTRVFVGAQKGDGGRYTAVFIFVGKDGISPRM